MARSVFYGVGAFIGSITGPTTCAFWPDDPNKLKWDPTLLVKVDLANNPEAVRQCKIAQADVDDFAGYGSGGLTRVGPMFPGGATMGTLYLEESKCAALGVNDPTKGARAYEWMTVVYYDGALAGRRFHGFHGLVQNVIGNVAMVSLWARGTSAVAGQGPMGTYALDLSAHFHPSDGTVPMIPITKGTQGALFIDAKAGGGVSTFDTPKTPKWAGGVPAPEGRRVR